MIQGMFLYAKLVMQNLEDQPSLDHLRKELEPDCFPSGLDEAYVIHWILPDLTYQLDLCETGMAEIFTVSRQILVRMSGQLLEGFSL
jgi:hypothetical protein